MSAGATSDLKVNTTKLVRIDLDARVCRRYSGREQTHGYLFDSEDKITPQLIGVMLAQPDTVGIVEGPQAEAA